MPLTNWLIYIPHRANTSVLEKCLQSFAPYTDRVLLIDQSQPPFLKHTGPYHRWQGKPHFSKIQNWIQADAMNRKLDCFFFAHSDVVIKPGAIETLLAYADTLPENWGVVFTHYDALCLFNPSIIRIVGPWDEDFNWYVADCDYYNRIRWAGFTTHSLPEVIQEHQCSQTLNALSEDERQEVAAQHEQAIARYQEKWGCHWEQGMGRRWDHPYDLTPPSQTQ